MVKLMKNIQSLQTFNRGALTVIEDCPFEIKRVFWIYGVVDGQARADHSHDLCEQILICVNGSVTVKINGTINILSEPDKMIYIPVNTMITLHFTKDAILLVLASELYDPKDNIS